MSEEECASYSERIQKIRQDMEEQNIDLSTVTIVSTLCKLYSVVGEPEEAQRLLENKMQLIDAKGLNDVIYGTHSQRPYLPCLTHWRVLLCINRLDLQGIKYRKQGHIATRD